MSWFTVLKGLSPEERRQTVDFWPPEDMPFTWNKSKWPKEKMNAYLRLKRRNFERQPTKEEVEEEMKNPTKTKFNPRYTRSKMKIKPEKTSERIPLEYPKDWQDNIRLRPKNYNKVKNIILYLKANNKPLSRNFILEELDQDFLTNEDNLAIEYVLKELKNDLV